jgi:hypothetical protein
MTESGHPRAKPVPVEVCYARYRGIADEQQAALERFQAIESDLYAKARAAIYDRYRSTYVLLDEKLAAAAPLFAMVPMKMPLPPDLDEIEDQARKSGKSPEEMQAILFPKIQAALEEQLRRPGSEKSTWASLIPKMRSLLPKIEKGNELDGRVRFGSILVCPPKKGLSRIGIVLECPWDEEHGMGLVIANGEIEEVGDSGVALLAAREPAPRKKRRG